MKTLRTISFIGMLTLVLSSFSNSSNIMSLNEAIAQKKVDVKIIAKGGYSGNSVDLQIRNLAGSSLKLKLSPGTVFIPGDNGQQTLLAAGNEMFVLNSNQTKIFPVNAFCSELHDHSPNLNTGFTMNATTREPLRKLAKYLDSLHVNDAGLIQSAVWSVSDGEDVSSIYSENDTAKANSVRRFVCALTGQKDTWYNKRNRVTVDEHQNIVMTPVEVKGELEFESAVQVEIHGCITDSTGKVIYNNPHSLTAGPGTIGFDFQMRVEGWKKGKYYVIYTSNGKEMLKQMFEV